ncbi:MAG: fibronectin type III-like domain-contianing protein [Lachnospiraceae bacterium]|nr:fibronectin type III-like domain-contianing protein [Lachnospiraceae bacterium]
MYRYFDTFNVEAAYTLGYGLSYTEFSISDISVEVSDDMSEAVVSACVTNTGDTWAGKEVVQVYTSYDYAGSEKAYIETAYQELKGYAKTQELAPGESEALQISIDLTKLSVYDETTDQFVVQAGDYLLRVGNSSDNTVVSAVLTLDETVTVKQCTAEIFTIKDDETVEGDDAENLEALSLTYDDITLEELSYKTWDTEGATVIALDAEKMAALFEDVSSTFDRNSVVTYISTDETTDSYAYQNRDTENLTDREESYETVDTEDGYTLVDVYEGTITMEQLVASMSVEELADIVTGLSSEQTEDLYDEDSDLFLYVTTSLSGYQGTQNLMTSRFVPLVFQADGPEGIGVTLSYADIWEGNTEEDTEDVSYSSIRLPSETVMAQTWNTDLIYELGSAVGQEMIDAGLSIWLAPGANIHRNPLNGRNYQYYSEDPYISGTMLTAEVGGVQSHEGVFCCVKHFAVNNMETNRGSVNEVISERALREIYLAGWEMCQNSDSPSGAVMTAYNQVNGTYCGESYDICTALLRGEWNYEGLIMDDYTPFFFMVWRNLVTSVRMGNNLVMPGNTTSDVGTGPLGDGYVNPYADAEYNGVSAPFQSDSYLMTMAIDSGEMLLGELQQSAMYILNVYMKTDIFAQIYDAVTTYDIQPTKAS